MSDVKLYLLADGLGRPATRGLRVGDELTLSDRKAGIYIDRGWASATKPSAEAIREALAITPPPARPARKTDAGRTPSASRKVKAPAKRKAKAQAKARPKAATPPPTATTSEG